MDREYFHWAQQPRSWRSLDEEERAQKHLDWWKEGWKSRDQEQCAESLI